VDFTLAVLATVDKDENPSICKEEIEHLFCMRMQAGDEIKGCHKKLMRFAATTAAAERAITAAEMCAVAELKRKQG
jgi:hypothetical protein